MLTPAAQYLRLSSSSQIGSLSGQIETLAKFAEAHDYVIVRTYQDIGRSGVSQSRRDGLASLLRDIHTDAPFSTLLVSDVTRWGRYQDPDEAAYLEFMCRLAGVTVRYCAESFADDASLASSIHKNIKRVMAAEYSRQLSDRSRAGTRRTALAGGRQGSVVPYGFARSAVNDDGVPVEMLGPGERASRQGQQVQVVAGPDDEVLTVRRIFDLFVNGACTRGEIARLLNREQIPHRGGDLWNVSRVRAVLENELAIGVQCFNRRVTRFDRIERNNPPSEWIRVQVLQPVVDPALFRAAATSRDTMKGRRYSDSAMIQILRRLHSQFGRLTMDIITQDPDAPAGEAYIHRFGSMRAAYRLAGYDPGRARRRRPSPPFFDDATLLQRLADLHKTQGQLSSKIIDAAPDLPRAHQIAAHFGGLREAYALIGCRQSRGPKSRSPAAQSQS